MALQVNVIRRIKFGNAFGVVAELTADDKYPTGGYPLTGQQLGLHVVENILAQSPASGKLWEYDFANSKIKLLSAAGTQVASESDQKTAKTRITAFGW